MAFRLWVVGFIRMQSVLRLTVGARLAQDRGVEALAARVPSGFRV